MPFLHLANAVFCEPWAMRPDYHANMSRVLASRLTGSPLPPHSTEAAFAVRREQLAALAPGQPVVGPVDGMGSPMVPQMVKAGALALIPVWGILGRRLSMMDLMCGGCDYEHLSQFFDMARTDSSVRVVAIDFDSPGGMVRGLPECADALARLAAEKPVIGYTSGLCCSAAYYLACYVRELRASPSAEVGNIGTRLAAVDDSEEWAKAGLKLELFASGPIKGTGVPGKPWTDEDRAFFTARMETARDDFFAVVRSHRPQVAPEVFDGRWLTGAEAVAVGLIDGVTMTLQELVGVAAIAAGMPLLDDLTPNDENEPDDAPEEP